VGRYVYTAIPRTVDGAELALASCHASPLDTRGMAGRCLDCHAEPQVHLGQFGTDCTSCHSTPRWEGAVFAHTYPLTRGGRGQIPCATCHTNPQQSTVYTCDNCHAHPQAATLAEHRSGA
jgi:Zn finger protein HypA/HybF involved in hydrogenase expression